MNSIDSKSYPKPNPAYENLNINSRLQNNFNNATNKDPNTSEGGQRYRCNEECNDIIKPAPSTVDKSFTGEFILNPDLMPETIDELTQSPENDGPLIDEIRIISAETFLNRKGNGIINDEKSNHNCTNKDSNNYVANLKQKKIAILDADIKITQKALNTCIESNNDALNIQNPDIQCDPSKILTEKYENENVINGSQLKNLAIHNPNDCKENCSKTLNQSNIDNLNEKIISDTKSFHPDIHLNAKNRITDINGSCEAYSKKPYYLQPNPQHDVGKKSKTDLKLPASDDSFNFVSDSENYFTNFKEHIKHDSAQPFPVPISNYNSDVSTVFEDISARKPDNLNTSDDSINTDSIDFSKLNLGLNIDKVNSKCSGNNTDSLIKTAKSKQRFRTYLSPSPKKLGVSNFKSNMTTNLLELESLTDEIKLLKKENYSLALIINELKSSLDKLENQHSLVLEDVKAKDKLIISLKRDFKNSEKQIKSLDEDKYILVKELESLKNDSNNTFGTTNYPLYFGSVAINNAEYSKIYTPRRLSTYFKELQDYQNLAENDEIIHLNESSDSLHIIENKNLSDYQLEKKKLNATSTSTRIEKLDNLHDGTIISHGLEDSQVKPKLRIGQLGLKKAREIKKRAKRSPSYIATSNRNSRIFSLTEAQPESIASIFESAGIKLAKSDSKINNFNSNSDDDKFLLYDTCNVDVVDISKCLEVDSESKSEIKKEYENNSESCKNSWIEHKDHTQIVPDYNFENSLFNINIFSKKKTDSIKDDSCNLTSIDSRKNSSITALDDDDLTPNYGRLILVCCCKLKNHKNIVEFINKKKLSFRLENSSAISEWEDLIDSKESSEATSSVSCKENKPKSRMTRIVENLESVLVADGASFGFLAAEGIGNQITHLKAQYDGILDRGTTELDLISKRPAVKSILSKVSSSFETIKEVPVAGPIFYKAVHSLGTNYYNRIALQKAKNCSKLA
ncbi:hypothetical protein AYI70_g1870 [Smittium culicis]|uniref:Uncharacterized protein n=1 Tax=Smittium culicis TaxID=133412 RepID=A0A1R1YAT2_9FUNG|nr:hypothetical protein AYI70_g1870 [Smittium culicis]